MTEEELEARQKILNAACDMLREGMKPQAITVRRIAERAGVGIGLINYHFQSRDKLLNEAVTTLMGEQAELWLDPTSLTQADPLDNLHRLLKETSRIGIQFPAYTQVAVKYELEQGEVNVPTLLLPLLHQIYGVQKSELEIRLIAFALVTALQVAMLRLGAFRRYTGINVLNDQQRDQCIDLLIENLIQIERKSS
ncbi:MAG TPA: TetR/AcrR family transcriptional regulator [Longilinea sp.]|nr:TetR/AcrR family transcriptional regulator [Longilinea sp.]